MTTKTSRNPPRARRASGDQGRGCAGSSRGPDRPGCLKSPARSGTATIAGATSFDLPEVDWVRIERWLIASRCVLGRCPVENVPPDRCPHEICPFGYCPPHICPW